MSKNNEEMSIFKQIFKINLLYANPSYTEKAMRSEKYKINPKKLFDSVGISKHILLGILLMVVYTAFFAVIDYSKFPYMVDLSIGIFMLMNIFQTFTYFYNVFYESSDVEGYMVLPISQKTVFRAKIAVVSISTLELAIPLFPLFVIYMLRIGQSIVPSVLLGLIDFAIAFAIIMIVNCMAMEIMSRSAVLSKFRRKIITTITVITTIINVVFILGIQNVSQRLSEKALSGKHIKVVYGPISSALKSYKSHIILIAVMAVVIYIFYRKFIVDAENSFYFKNREINSSGKYGQGSKKKGISKAENRKDAFKSADKTVSNEFESSMYNSEGTAEKNEKTGGKNINSNKSEKSFMRATLFKYNLSLISDTTVVSQTMMVIIFPIIVLYPQFKNINSLVSGMDMYSIRLFGVGVGIVLGIMYNMYPNGLHAVMLSLDGENYNYIKSLPISEKYYIKNKLLFATVVSSIVPTIIVAVVCFLLKVPILYTLIGLVLMWLMCYSIGSQWLVYDRKHIITSWQNTSEIYARNNKAINFVMMFMIVFIGSLIIGGIAMAGDAGYGKYLLPVEIIAALAISAVALIKTHMYMKKHNLK